jgi:ADP-ribose pyrophosphatase
MLKPYRPISKSILFSNPWWKYCLDRVELPSGKSGEYHYVLTNGSSMIIPVEANGMILLVRQYRYTGNRESLEFPCGGVKDGATYEETAKEEMVEETGFLPGKIIQAGSFNPCNGLLDEICRVYIARNLKRVGARPDETENFELVRLTLDEIDNYILDGTIWDGMTLAAWAIARPKMG